MTDVNLPGTQEEKLNDIRSRLESVFRSLATIQAIIIVTGEALSVESTECSSEVALILMKCASNPLHEEMKQISTLIEALGGTTAYSEKEDDEREGGD